MQLKSLALSQQRVFHPAHERFPNLSLCTYVCPRAAVVHTFVNLSPLPFFTQNFRYYCVGVQARVFGASVTYSNLIYIYLDISLLSVYIFSMKEGVENITYLLHNQFALQNEF